MRIAKATTEAIKYACLHYHYLHKYITTFNRRSYSIFNDNDEFCGTICYSVPANMMIAKKFNLLNGEVLELARVALNGKQKWTSQAVAMSLRQLKKDFPQVKLVISYADTMQGHIGTIYQACNFFYIHKTSSSRFYLVGKKLFHKRTFTNKRRKKVKEYTEFKLEEKLLYVYAYDAKLREELRKKALKYEKKDVNLSQNYLPT